jgi:hypothetical protein
MSHKAIKVCKISNQTEYKVPSAGYNVTITRVNARRKKGQYGYRPAYNTFRIYGRGGVLSGKEGMGGIREAMKVINK